MTWGFVAVAGATVVGGALAADAAGDAADTQAGATAAATAEQRRASEAALAEQQRQFDLTRHDFAPYRIVGERALGELGPAINQPFTGAEALAEPGYEFGLRQGQLALDRKAAAAGGRVSGAALKSAAEYATNYATTGYNAAYQRRQDRLNRLAALAGIGQSATGSSAAAGATSAGNISNILTSTGQGISGLISSQGDAAAAGRLAQGNIWGNAANQLGAVAQRWATAPTASSGMTIPTSPYSGYTGDYNALGSQYQ